MALQTYFVELREARRRPRPTQGCRADDDDERQEPINCRQRKQRQKNQWKGKDFANREKEGSISLV